MKHSRMFALVLATFIAGCGHGHNYEQTSVYYRAIRDVLIAKGLCRDERECDTREMILSEGGTFKGSPVHVNVYNVADPTTVNEIIEAARAARPSATVGVELRITGSKHLDTPYKSVVRVSVD